MFKWFADIVVYEWLGLTRGEHFAESLNFFVYDVPKIFALLLSVIFIVAVIRTYFPPERIKKLLSHQNEIVGNFAAATFGVFIPFCTCSAIPLFIGMLESGVPLGVAMSFVIASPMINEIALVLLWGLFGWQIAVTYTLCGMLIAVVGGYIIGRLKMEKYVEQFVVENTCKQEINYSSFKDRVAYAASYAKNIFKAIWLYIVIGVGIGAAIHGYIPVEFVSKYAGPGNPFAVVIAIILGVPLYANCAGAIPVVQAILEKGLPLGTTLAFMMAVTGLSLPEFIILRKVLKLRLLITFFLIVATGIVLVGYFFNWVF